MGPLLASIDGTELTMLPQHGRLQVFLRGSSTCVTDAETLETIYSDGEWLPVSDEDGFGCMVQEGGQGKPLCVEDMVTKSLYRAPNDDVYLHNPNAPESGQAWSSWTTHKRRFLEGEVSWKHDLKISVYRLTWPRCGCRHFFDLHQIYRLRHDGERRWTS